MKKYLLNIAVAVAALSVIGCGPEGPTEAKVLDPKDANGAVDVVQTNAEVKNSVPKDAEQGAAYRIAPADPNDKRFQPDPKLAGGG